MSQQVQTLSAEEYRELAKKHKAAMMFQIKTFIITGCLMIIAVCAFILFSAAWFANNKRVNANNSVNSADAPASLYIEAGTTKTDAFTFELEPTQLSGNLYPISTVDATNWWYVTGWSGVKANKYAKASISQNATKQDRYEYTYNSKTYTAYNQADYVVYCDPEKSMDVYFDPDGGLVLENETGEDKNPKELLKALRVAVFVDGSLKVIYAPTAETGVGNSSGTVVEKFYGVSAADTVVAMEGQPHPVLTNLAPYTATLSEEYENTYEAGGDKTKLCTTSYTGNNIKLIVWLEGTDAEAIIGKSDNASSVKITLKLVGIENE